MKWIIYILILVLLIYALAKFPDLTISAGKNMVSISTSAVKNILTAISGA